MTTEELKANRRAICEALIEGKQCQYINKEGIWNDGAAFFVASILFDDIAEQIRIKPEPRKVWVGWHGRGQCLATNEEEKRFYEGQWSLVKWQPVEEQV